MVDILHEKEAMFELLDKHQKNLKLILASQISTYARKILFWLPIDDRYLVQTQKMNLDNKWDVSQVEFNTLREAVDAWVDFYISTFR
jgi:hypothetical protein